MRPQPIIFHMLVPVRNKQLQAVFHQIGGIFFLVAVSAGGLAGVVNDPGFGVDGHAIALVTEPGAEVHVLESIDVVLVKQAHFHEYRPPHNHAGGGDDLKKPPFLRQRALRRNALVKMTNAHKRRNAYPQMLHRIPERFTFRIQQQGAGSGNVRPCGKIVQQRLIPAGQRLRIIIEKNEKFPGRHPGPQVGGRAEVQIGCGAVVAKGLPKQRAAKNGAGLRRHIRGAVVHYNDFHVPVFDSGRQGLEAGARQVPLIKHRDNDGGFNRRHPPP